MKTNKEMIFLKLSKKKLNKFDILKLYKLLLQLSFNDFKLAKLFLDNYYDLESFPEEFYKAFLYCIHTDRYNELFIILLNRNIYDLINFLKNDNLKIKNINAIINPIDYFKLPTKQIKFILSHIKNINLKNNDLQLKKTLFNKPCWLLRKPSTNTEEEFMKIAIKMYLSIGLDNAIEILCGKYGALDYEIIHYLFNNLNVKNINPENNIVFNEFLFSNKKDYNNTMRLMLEGNFLELFINFDYLYNNLSYYIGQLGTNFNKSKLSILLKERYLAPILETPEINGNVLDDMISSYNHKYGITDNENEIIDKNMDAYSKLKSKTKSSIIQTDIPKLGDFYFELLPLDDIRNLVIGYRAGNCFRINGDAFALFHNFLTNPHIRILSISTDKYKDFGMVLLMRNGNVLIAQGIEISKWVSNEIDNEKLYNAVQMAIKFIMDKINNEDDEIVASIIGLTNNNTAKYNHNILPFIINPILDNNYNFYNGVYNYQGLLDLKDGKTLKDIKLFIPSKFYFDKNNKVFTRNEFTSCNSIEYREIEKILISLRYARFKATREEKRMQYYMELAKRQEAYTICTLKWFIMTFKDGFVDSYINSDDSKIIEEYNLELEKIKRNN